MAEDSIISYSDLIGKDGTFEDIKKEIAIIEKQLLELAKKAKSDIRLTNPNDSEAINKLQKEIAELTQANKNLQKAKESNAKAQKKAIELTQEELIEIEKQKIARREQIQIAKQEAIIRKGEVDTIEVLRAKLSLVTIQWKKLTAEETKSTVAGVKLTAEKKRLTEQLTKLEKATGDARRQVGFYERTLGQLEKTAVRIFIGRTIVDGVRRLAGFFGDLIEKGKEYNSTLAGLSNSFEKVSNAFGFIGTKILEFLAPAITFVTNQLAKIPAFFGGIISAAKQFGSNVAGTFDVLGLKISRVFQQINKANPFSKQTTEEINRNIALIDQQIQLVQASQKDLTTAFNEGYNAVVLSQEEYAKNVKNAENAKDAEAERTKEIERQKELLLQINGIQSERLEAILSLQQQIERLEIENTENVLERALAFEDLRAKEEREARLKAFDKLIALIEQQELALIALYKENSKEVIAFREKTAKDIQEIEAFNAKLSEEQLEASEKRKLDIRKQYATETAALATIELENQTDKLNDSIKASIEQTQAEINALEEENAKKRSDAIKKQKEDAKQLISDISATANKIGEEIVSLYERQADLSAKSVEQQANNLERARDRAAQGLEANIAFEEQELAKRQAEQQRKEKQAKQAAKILTLFNLVSAYAQSGDENALFRGLADFALLEAISGGLEGFFEGTEDTGTTNKALDNKGGRLAVLHDNERVVPKVQNMLLRGMSNDDLVKNALIGSHISDTLPSLVQKNTFDIQKDEFIKATKATQISDSNALVVQELRQLNYRLAKQPNIGIEIQKVYENVYDIIKSEVKAGIKKTSKKRL